MTPNKLQVEIVLNDGSEPSYTNEKHDNVIEVEKSKLDEGAIFLNSHPEYSGYTEADEKRLKIKLDVILIPILTIAILVSAADKIILSNASLYGMSHLPISYFKDTELVKFLVSLIRCGV